MLGITIVLVMWAAAALVLVGRRAARSRREIRSVAAYQRTMALLTAAEHDAGDAQARLTPAAGQARRRPRSKAVTTTLVFDDVAPTSPLAARPLRPLPLDGPRHSPTRRSRGDGRTGQRTPARVRRRRIAAIAGGALFLLLGLMAAAAVSDATDGGRAARSEARQPSDAARSSAATAPPAPAPAPSALTVEARDVDGATYGVGAAAFGAALRATGPCWVRVQQGEGGPTLFEGTLAAGETRSFDDADALRVRVGAPNKLAVEVNGVPAELPAGDRPFDLTFTARG